MIEDNPGDAPIPLSPIEPDPNVPEPGREPTPDVETDAREDLADILGTGQAPAPVLTTPPEWGPPGREVVEAVRALGARVDRRLDELQNRFDREIRAEATREKVVDRLHAELQEYKQDLLLNTLRPVFIDLIQLHDDIGKVAVSPPVEDDEVEGHAESRRLVTLMEGFQQGIEDILYRQGVEPFHVEGDSFDPRRQRAVSTVVTDEPSLGKTVAARHRKGFRSGERVIRPEIVSVYALKKGTPAS